MYTLTRITRMPLLTEAERRLATSLIDRWDVVWPSLWDRPTLYGACERLLKRYGRDMLRRIEGLSEPATTDLAGHSAPEPQRHCDMVVLGSLLPRTEAA